VKRSGRDESVQVAIHMCMEAMLGISLYTHLYLQLEKCHVFLISCYVFSSTKLEKRAEQVLHGSKGGWGRGRWGWGWRGEMASTMYTHMN
jgi:hypothetical protein